MKHLIARVEVSKFIMASKTPKLGFGEMFRRAATRGGNWNTATFKEFPQVLYWLRSCLGLIIGIAWAVLKMEGQIGLISYVAASSLVIFLYYNTYVEADVQDFGQFELITSGFMPALAIFVLTWSILYTALHIDDDDIGFY